MAGTEAGHCGLWQLATDGVETPASVEKRGALVEPGESLTWALGEIFVLGEPCFKCRSQLRVVGEHLFCQGLDNVGLGVLGPLEDFTEEPPLEE